MQKSTITTNNLFKLKYSKNKSNTKTHNHPYKPSHISTKHYPTK